MSTFPLTRISVEQYHRMIDSGAFGEDDPIELLEGLVVDKKPKRRPHSRATRQIDRRLADVIPDGWDVLNQEPIFACQYFMSRGHWQIYNHAAKGKARVGGWKTLPVRDAPAEVVKLALRATAPIGDGLYGVDIKQTGNRCHVIEVNDNPNVDAGNEDGVLKDALYREIMGSFVRRIEARKRVAP